MRLTRRQFVAVAGEAPKIQTLIGLLLLAALAVGSGQVLADSESSSLTTAASPLPLDDVVNNLVRRNEERAQALQSFEATRVYHLEYHGFPGDREAEMTVHALYQSPDTKTFNVISESGSKLIRDRVFKKLLESEKEAARPDVRSHLQLNRTNYDFALAAYERSEQGDQYVLLVTPKSKSKYLYRGKIWVDGTEFAVTRIEAEPAQNPSFWTKKSEIHHDYIKVQGFWLPVRNESISYIRLGGRATLTIDYKDYRVNRARDTAGISASPSDPGLIPPDPLANQ